MSAVANSPPGRSQVHVVQSLKPKPRCQLDIARTSAPQEGIACAHVGCGRRGQEAYPASGAVKSVLQKVHAEGWPQRIGKVGVVEEIVEVHQKLHGKPFRQLCVLGQAEVEGRVTRPDKRVAAKIAEMLIPGATYGCRIEVARNLEGLQVE